MTDEGRMQLALDLALAEWRREVLTGRAAERDYHNGSCDRPAPLRTGPWIPIPAARHGGAAIQHEEGPGRFQAALPGRIAPAVYQPAMANLVHNERIKLRAGLFNTAAGATIALGVLAPIVAAFYGLGNARPPLFWLLIGATVWLGAAAALHAAALWMLRRLRE